MEVSTNTNDMPQYICQPTDASICDLQQNDGEESGGIVEKCHVQEKSVVQFSPHPNRNDIDTESKIRECNYTPHLKLNLVSRLEFEDCQKTRIKLTNCSVAPFHVPLALGPGRIQPTANISPHTDAHGLDKVCRLPRWTPERENVWTQVCIDC